MRPEAVILDLDGVLCRTDHFHYLAWDAVANTLRVPFDLNINNRLRGVDLVEDLEIILERYPGELLDEEKQELAEMKNDLYRRYVQKLTPSDFPDEIRVTCSELKSMGLLLGVGSESKNAKLILSQLGLDGFFDAISDGNNVTQVKPDPEVLFKAATYMNVEPNECWAVESSAAGIIAARRAGMCAVAYDVAAKDGLGDYNLNHFSELLGVIQSVGR